MLIIGSKALKYHFPSLNRKINDIDIIGYGDDLNMLTEMLKPTEVKKGKYSIILKNITNKTHFFDADNVELILADESESLKLYMKYNRDHIFASKEVLFSLKKSHIHYPIKFEKHVKDFRLLFDYFQGIDMLADITVVHEKETQERLGKLKTPKLNKSVTEFFGQSKDYVKSFFVHDDIHRIMSHYERPLYEKMQKDDQLAICEKKKWLEFAFEDKCKCVLEEAYVIALERKIIPMIFGAGKGYTSKEAFDWALMRICTTLCSGWFREFATVNYFKIKDRMDNNYVEKFLTAYENGSIPRQ